MPACTVCKICPDIQKHSMQNARILFIIKSELPGYNVKITRFSRSPGKKCPSSCHPKLSSELKLCSRRSSDSFGWHSDGHFCQSPEKPGDFVPESLVLSASRQCHRLVQPHKPIKTPPFFSMLDQPSFGNKSEMRNCVEDLRHLTFLHLATAGHIWQ